MSAIVEFMQSMVKENTVKLALLELAGTFIFVGLVTLFTSKKFEEKFPFLKALVPALVGVSLLATVYLFSLFGSKGHFNPAVTLPLCLASADYCSILPFWAGQLTGGSAGSGLVNFVLGLVP